MLGIVFACKEMSVSQDKDRIELHNLELTMNASSERDASPLQNLNAFKMYSERIFKCHLHHI